MGTSPSRHGNKVKSKQTEQKSSQRASGVLLPEPEFGEYSSLVFLPRLADQLSDLQYIVNDIDATEDIYKQDASRSVSRHERDECLSEQCLSEQCNRSLELRKNEKNQSNGKPKHTDQKRNKEYSKPAAEGEVCIKEELHQVVVKLPNIKETKGREGLPEQSCLGDTRTAFKRPFENWFSTKNDSHNETRSRFGLWIDSIKRRIIFWRWYEHHCGSVVRIVRFLQRHVRKRGEDIVFVF